MKSAVPACKSGCPADWRRACLHYGHLSGQIEKGSQRNLAMLSRRGGDNTCRMELQQNKLQQDLECFCQAPRMQGGSDPKAQTGMVQARSRGAMIIKAEVFGWRHTRCTAPGYARQQRLPKTSCRPDWTSLSLPACGNLAKTGLKSPVSW